MDNVELPSVIENDSDLQVPPLPWALPEVLGPLHESGFAGAEAVSAAVDCDPRLESGILRRINSHLRRPIGELDPAVQMIGPVTAAGLVVELSMRRWRPLRDGPAGPQLTRLIYHSEATAALTQRLLRGSSGGGEPPDRDDPSKGAPDPSRDHPPRDQPEPSAEEASPTQSAPMWASFEWKGFAQGLICDLGKLVLLHSYPEKAAALYSQDRTDRGYGNADPQVMEQAAFGCDHVEAAAWAAETLHLPEPLADAATQRRGSTVGENQGVHAARVANLLTKTMAPELAGISATSATRDWETCAEHPAWRAWVEDASRPSLEAVTEEFSKETVLYTRFLLDLPVAESFSD
ncbi:HDOD domain-containing protein [Salinibacter ruber]|uniref:HDOD domain-containing protein n=1 Tax=Salinibacter ruber TaxID=146919 RepID=UPI002073AAFA|nr:HDOD domain-containing protein [Salinibacter ruber]